MSGSKGKKHVTEVEIQASLQEMSCSGLKIYDMDSRFHKLAVRYPM